MVSWWYEMKAQPLLTVRLFVSIVFATVYRAFQY